MLDLELLETGNARSMMDFMKALTSMKEGLVAKWVPLVGCIFGRMSRLHLVMELRRYGHSVDEDDFPDDDQAYIKVMTPLIHFIMSVRMGDDNDPVYRICLDPVEPRCANQGMLDSVVQLMGHLSSLPTPTRKDFSRVRDQTHGSIERIRRLQVGESIEDLKPRSWDPDDDALWPSAVRCRRLDDRPFLKNSPGLSGALKDLSRRGHYLGCFELGIGSWAMNMFLVHNPKTNELTWISFAAEGQDPRTSDPGPVWQNHFMDLVLRGIPWRMLMKLPPTSRIADVGTMAREKGKP